MLTELAFCARSSRSPQGIVYLKKALRYIDEHYLEDIDIPAYLRICRDQQILPAGAL